MSDLKRQVTGETDSTISATMQTSIADGVVVMEKEFRSNQGHSEKITYSLRISETEFITCSEDHRIKVWDKHMAGCRYTIETHEQLHTMAITGEYLNLLVSGYGEMDFIVFGLD